MIKREQMDRVLQAQTGIILSSDAAALGITRPYFSEYVAKNGLERVSRGIYLAPDAMGDSFFTLQSC